MFNINKTAIAALSIFCVLSFSCSKGDEAFSSEDMDLLTVEERLGPPPPTIDEYLEFMVSNLEHKDWQERESSIITLHFTKDAQYFDEMFNMIDDEHSFVRWRAIESVCDFSYKDFINHADFTDFKKEHYPSLKEKLITLLKDDDEAVRWRSIDCFKKLKMKDVSNNMAPLLFDKNAIVREHLIDAFSTFDKEYVVSYLIEGIIYEEEFPQKASNDEGTLKSWYRERLKKDKKVKDKLLKVLEEKTNTKFEIDEEEDLSDLYKKWNNWYKENEKDFLIIEEKPIETPEELRKEEKGDN